MAGKNVIVFPTDFSEASLAALPWARRMAGEMQAEIHCIYVVEEPHIYASMASFASAHLREGGIITRVLVGRPAEEVVRYAREKNAGLIIMTTHGYSGVKHVLLGSTTEAVLRHASCPVLSIRNA